MAITYSAAILH